MFVPFFLGVVGIDDLDDLDVGYDLNPELVEVEAYERADGTVVEAHVRTAPNATVEDNLSFWGLVNS